MPLKVDGKSVDACDILYTGNIWQGKILVNHEVKAIGEEKFGE